MYIPQAWLAPFNWVQLDQHHTTEPVFPGRGCQGREGSFRQGGGDKGKLAGRGRERRKQEKGKVYGDFWEKARENSGGRENKMFPQVAAGPLLV